MPGEDKVLSPREIADKWAVAAQRLPFEAAKNLGAASSTWTTFLTGAIGAFSIGGLAFLPPKLGELDVGERNWVVLLLFAGAATALVARYLATLAAQVTPVMAFTDGEEYRNQTQEQNFQAAKRLLQSQRTSTVALAFLLLGIMFSLIPADKPYRLVHQRSEASFCGKLVSDKEGEIYITGTSSQATKLTKLSGVTEIVRVAECPAVPDAKPAPTAQSNSPG